MHQREWLGHAQVEHRDYHAHGGSGLQGGGKCGGRVNAGRVVTNGEGAGGDAAALG